MSADEGKEEYDEVQQDLRKRDEEVRNALKNKFYLQNMFSFILFFSDMFFLTTMQAYTFI